MNTNRHQFIKGNIPFNKGMKGLLVHSKETKLRISQKLTGIKRPPRTKEHTEKIASQLRGRKQTIKRGGWHLSLANRKKISKNISGEKHYNWQGGITPVNKMIRHSLEYRLWRTAVFERDNYTYLWCGTRNYEGKGKTTILHADHIKPFSEYPELRFAIDNGRTLCIDCHRTTETYGGRRK